MARHFDDSLWYRKKSQVLDEFGEASRALKDQVAAQSHSRPPGHIQRQLSSLERKTKYQLSDANMSIIEKAVEMDLKQRRMDNDAALRRSRILFEIRKAEAYAALQREQANITKVNTFSDLALDLALYNIAARESYIIAEKARLQEEVEECRQQITALPPETYLKELELYESRLLTTQKKLEALPFVEAMLAKQAEVLVSEAAARDERQSQLTSSDAVEEARVQIVAEQLNLNAAKGLLYEENASTARAKKDYITRADDLYGYAQNKLAKVNLYVEGIQSLIEPTNLKTQAVQAYAEELKELKTPLQTKKAKVLAYAAKLEEYADDLPAKIAVVLEYAEKLKELEAPMLEKALAIDAYAALQDQYILAMQPFEGAYSSLQAAELAAAQASSELASARVVLAGIEQNEVVPAQVAKAASRKTQAEAQKLISEGYKALAEAEQFVADAKEAIVTELDAKVAYIEGPYMAALEELNGAILAQVAAYDELMAARVLKAQAQQEQNQARADLVLYQAEGGVEKEKTSAYRSQLSLLQNKTRGKEATLQSAAYDRLETASSSLNATREANYDRRISAETDKAEYVLVQRLLARQTAMLEQLEAEEDYIGESARDRYDAEVESAELTSAARVTGELIHMIGGTE